MTSTWPSTPTPAPEGQYGTSRGSIAFYYPGSIQGKWAADIIANNLRSIYPLPDKVRAVSTTTLGEVRKVRAPAVLLELAFHDNPDDAAWIKNNLDEIARNLVLSVTEFFGLPFLTPIPARSGMVDVNWGSLNIRSRPSLDAPVLAQAPDGALLTIINQWQDWYLVNYNGTIGYAQRQLRDAELMQGGFYGYPCCQTGRYPVLHRPFPRRAHVPSAGGQSTP